MKHNTFGEVIAVNGLITGQHIGTPMQDAIAENPEDNEPYVEERKTLTRIKNSESLWDIVPQPGGGNSELPVLSNPATADQILEGYEAIDKSGNLVTGTCTFKKVETGTKSVAASTEKTKITIGDDSEIETVHGILVRKSDHQKMQSAVYDAHTWLKTDPYYYFASVINGKRMVDVNTGNSNCEFQYTTIGR